MSSSKKSNTPHPLRSSDVTRRDGDSTGALTWLERVALSDEDRVA